MPLRPIRTRRIARFGLTSPDASRLVAFYQAAFDARWVSSDHLSAATVEACLRVPGSAIRHVLALGDQEIEILQFEQPGAHYPPQSLPYSSAFQHFALVVSDMAIALSRLQRLPGWTAQSSEGPQRLPPRSGGVTAFKFQDPDGHPLEFLQFAVAATPSYWNARTNTGNFLGIDHSAISVRDTATSIGFYQSLGFHVSSQTLNYGIEQSRLDGIPEPQVQVTSLATSDTPPHLELLCYQQNPGPPAQVLLSNAVAATRLLLAVDHAQIPDNPLVTDPDGHHLVLML